jgi:hypothetical protein
MGVHDVWEIIEEDMKKSKAQIKATNKKKM